jgi:hypothetical protein
MPSSQREEHDRGIATSQYRTNVAVAPKRSDVVVEEPRMGRCTEPGKSSKIAQSTARMGASRKILDDGASHVEGALGCDRSCVAVV